MSWPATASLSVRPRGLVRGNLAATLAAAAIAGHRLKSPAYLVESRAYTYADVFAGMRAAAAGLARRGIHAEDRVLIVLPDGIDLVWTFLASLYLGAIAILVNPRLTASELATAAASADPKLVVTDPSWAETFPGGPVVEVSRISSGQAGAKGAAAHACAVGHLAYGLFTSGTTGDPKLCFHTHSDPLVYDQAFGQPVLGLRPGDVVLSVSKSYFAYGLGNSILYPLLSGATALLESNPPTAETVLAGVSRFRVDVLFGVPSFYARLLAHPQAEALSQVRIAVSAGEILPRKVEEGLEGLLGSSVLNSIGSTEVGQAFAASRIGERRPGTVGRALAPYRIKITDGAARELPNGAEGQLLVQGPTLTTGVARALEYEPPTPGLWHPTGDLAIVGADGYLEVKGRIDDIEIVGGINVHPREIEDLLLEHPEVREGAVCSVVDAHGISRLIAYVVTVDPSVDATALEPDLLSRLRDRLAPYKVPRRVVLVSHLPRTPTGKLRRRALREAAAQHQAAGSASPWRPSP
jgi:4-hydroxybenzoate adenylyltransferase